MKDVSETTKHQCRPKNITGRFVIGELLLNFVSKLPFPHTLVSLTKLVGVWLVTKLIDVMA